MPVDYEALAKKYGGQIVEDEEPAQQVDYEALAAKHGGQVVDATGTPEPDKPGFSASAADLVTGNLRTTPEIEALPEWTDMPELNQMSMASFKTALGTMLTNPAETTKILQANFPGSQVRQDAKGNYILKSSVDGKEYAIPPGLSVGDIPRVLGGLLAFTPAGKATTIPGAIAAGAGTQAAIEASQIAAGGEFDADEVTLAGITGGAGQALQRLMPAGRQAAQRAAQATPDQSIAQQSAQALPDQEALDKSFSSIGDLVRKASSGGHGSTAAKARLIDMAQVNTEAKAAADRLGMDLPFDVFSDNPQIRATVGLTRSAAGSEAEAAWINTLRNTVDQADEVVKQFDASFIEGRPSTGAVSQRILDSLNATRSNLSNDADEIYKRVDDVVPKTLPAEFPKLQQTLDDVLAEVGEKGLTAQEKNLLKLVSDGDATYGRLIREKNLIGQAMAGKDSPYGNMAAGDLKRLYGALAEDQLTNVGKHGGEALRKELRAANLLTAKKKALETRIIGAFGKDADGSVATLMQSAIKSASKGDAAQFNKLLKAVPPELHKETIATALASVTSSGRAARDGAFGFAEFAKTYQGLRANPPVYAKMIDALGKKSDQVLRDLYDISKRITEARAMVLSTGKANQALVDSLTAESLIGKVMHSTMLQRAATSVAGTVPGGGFIAPDIIKFMSKGNADAVDAAGKLFASDEFQRLAIEAATRQAPSASTISNAAKSKAFTDFAKAARLPQSLDARMQWLNSAVQTARQFKEE